MMRRDGSLIMLTCGFVRPRPGSVGLGGYGMDELGSSTHLTTLVSHADEARLDQQFSGAVGMSLLMELQLLQQVV